MRKPIVWMVMLLLLLATAGSAMGVSMIEPDPGPTPVPMIGVQLTVTITGDGRVVSNPAGIDCTFSGGAFSGDCSNVFAANESVALYAEGIEVDEGFFSIPCGWNQSGGVNEPPVFAVTMDAPQSVEANFCYLGPPAFALPPPDGQDIYGPYLPVPDPVITVEEADIKPVAVEELADGSLRISVGLPNYFGPGPSGVDVYVGLTVPGVRGMWLFTPGGLQPASSGLVPWKTNQMSEIKKELLLDLPKAVQALLPAGIYNLYVMATPTGSTATWTVWITYFNLQTFSVNPFP